MLLCCSSWIMNDLIREIFKLEDLMPKKLDANLIRFAYWRIILCNFNEGLR